MHNPLRSEAEMFRVVLIVGIAAAPVIALALIFGPEWGAILLAIEIGVGIWLADRRIEPAGVRLVQAADRDAGVSDRRRRSAAVRARPPHPGSPQRGDGGGPGACELAASPSLARRRRSDRRRAAAA